MGDAITLCDADIGSEGRPLASLGADRDPHPETNTAASDKATGAQRHPMVGFYVDTRCRGSNRRKDSPAVAAAARAEAGPITAAKISDLVSAVADWLPGCPHSSRPLSSRRRLKPFEMPDRYATGLGVDRGRLN